MTNPKPVITDFRQAWMDYRKSKDYGQSIRSMKKKGLVQPYAHNILFHAFVAGWLSTGKQIQTLDE